MDVTGFEAHLHQALRERRRKVVIEATNVLDFEKHLNELADHGYSSVDAASKHSVSYMAVVSRQLPFWTAGPLFEDDGACTVCQYQHTNEEASGL